MKKNKISFEKFVVYCFALLWVMITFLPLISTFFCSGKDNNEITLGMLKIPQNFIWQNYADAFLIANMGRAVLNSIFVATLSTIIVVLFGMLAGYILARKKLKAIPFLYSLFIIGVMIPVHTTIIPISSIATTFHSRDSYIMLILVYAAFNISQAVFLFTGYICCISKELDEAAIIDGCNDFQILYKILFPVAIPIITTESILCFIYGYGELIFSMCLIGDKTKYTISRAMLSFQGGHNITYGPIFASIIIAVIPMIIIYLLFHEKVQNGMVAGAVKG